MPGPTTCPASEVPAVLGMSDVPLSRAKRTSLRISSSVLGKRDGLRYLSINGGVRRIELSHRGIEWSEPVELGRQDAGNRKRWLSSRGGPTTADWGTFRREAPARSSENESGHLGPVSAPSNRNGIRSLNLRNLDRLAFLPALGDRNRQTKSSPEHPRALARVSARLANP